MDELRVDPADGNAYSRADFVAQYGGTAEWDAVGARMEAERQRQAAAAAEAERQRQAAMMGGGGGERRIDSSDGNAYTREEFIDAYGGTAEWDRAQRVGGSGGGGGAPPGGGLGAVPAAAAPLDMGSMSRAEQIKHKQAEQKAKIQAMKQAKQDELAAAEAQRVAAEQARIQAMQQAQAQAEAAAAAERARIQAEEKAAAEQAVAEAKRQEQFAASANQAAAAKKKALQKRQAAMANPLGLPGATAAAPAVALPTDDPWGFVASAPAAPAPVPAPAPAPAPAAPAATPYASAAFAGLGGAGGAAPPAAAGGGGTYTVVLPKTAAGFGINLNNTPTGDAFVEGFSHGGPQQAGVMIGSIFVTVAGVPVAGRGQVRRCAPHWCTALHTHRPFALLAAVDALFLMCVACDACSCGCHCGCRRE